MHRTLIRAVKRTYREIKRISPVGAKRFRRLTARIRGSKYTKPRKPKVAKRKHTPLTLIKAAEVASLTSITVFTTRRTSRQAFRRQRHLMASRFALMSKHRASMQRWFAQQMAALRKKVGVLLGSGTSTLKGILSGAEKKVKSKASRGAERVYKRATAQAKSTKAEKRLKASTKKKLAASEKKAKAAREATRKAARSKSGIAKEAAAKKRAAEAAVKANAKARAARRREAAAKAKRRQGDARAMERVTKMGANNATSCFGTVARMSAHSARRLAASAKGRRAVANSASAALSTWKARAARARYRLFRHLTAGKGKAGRKVHHKGKRAHKKASPYAEVEELLELDGNDVTLLQAKAASKDIHFFSRRRRSKAKARRSVRRRKVTVLRRRRHRKAKKPVRGRKSKHVRSKRKTFVKVSAACASKLKKMQGHFAKEYKRSLVADQKLKKAILMKVKKTKKGIAKAIRARVLIFHSNVIMKKDVDVADSAAFASLMRKLNRAAGKSVASRKSKKHRSHDEGFAKKKAKRKAAAKAATMVFPHKSVNGAHNMLRRKMAVERSRRQAIEDAFNKALGKAKAATKKLMRGTARTLGGIVQRREGRMSAEAKAKEKKAKKLKVVFHRNRTKPTKKDIHHDHAQEDRKFKLKAFRGSRRRRRRTPVPSSPKKKKAPKKKKKNKFTTKELHEKMRKNGVKKKHADAVKAAEKHHKDAYFKKKRLAAAAAKKKKEMADKTAERQRKAAERITKKSEIAVKKELGMHTWKMPPYFQPEYIKETKNFFRKHHEKCVKASKGRGMSAQLARKVLAEGSKAPVIATAVNNVHLTKASESKIKAKINRAAFRATTPTKLGAATKGLKVVTKNESAVTQVVSSHSKTSCAVAKKVCHDDVACMAASMVLKKAGTTQLGTIAARTCGKPAFTQFATVVCKCGSSKIPTQAACSLLAKLTAAGTSAARCTAAKRFAAPYAQEMSDLMDEMGMLQRDNEVLYQQQKELFSQQITPTQVSVAESASGEHRQDGLARFERESEVGLTEQQEDLFTQERM
jgi:hypothetical protein